MGALVKISGGIERHALIRRLLMLYLFLQPFAPFTSVRETAFVLILVMFAARLAAGGARVDVKDRAVIALGCLAAVSLISSLLGPYPVDSLDSMRKNLLYQAVLFLVIICEYRTMDGLRPLFFALFAGFAALSLLIVAKNDVAVLLNWLQEMNEKRGVYLGAYSVYATFYIPLALGYLYASEEAFWVKAALVFFLSLEFALTVLNNHRTQLVAVALPAAVVTLLARRFKTFAAGAALCVLLAAVMFHLKPQAFERYRTLASGQTYVSAEGLNDRDAIWKGTVDMIRERPVLGYGYGWKKIALAARDFGFLDRWDKDGRAYKYFSSTGYGRANPHNLALQILFEIGLLGLGAFLFFWAAVLSKAARAFRGPDSAAARFLKYGVAGVIISYALMNMTNGLWEETHGKLMLAFAGMAVVLHKEASSTRHGDD